MAAVLARADVNYHLLPWYSVQLTDRRSRTKSIARQQASLVMELRPSLQAPLRKEIPKKRIAWPICAKASRHQNSDSGESVSSVSLRLLHGRNYGQHGFPYWVGLVPHVWSIVSTKPQRGPTPRSKAGWPLGCVVQVAWPTSAVWLETYPVSGFPKSRYILYMCSGHGIVVCR